MRREPNPLPFAFVLLRVSPAGFPLDQRPGVGHSVLAVVAAQRDQGRSCRRGEVVCHDSGNAEGDRAAWLLDWFNELAGRLRNVRVCCGDWSRVVTPSVTWNIGGGMLTGVFLDPP